MLEESGARFPGDPASYSAGPLDALAEPRELDLLGRIADFPDVLGAAADDLAPHLMAFYLRELAGAFHSYYNAVRVLVPESDVRLARLALSAAVKQVLANGLAVLGVSAPERM
jgi:arginyl-tRNA synthetase